MDRRITLHPAGGAGLVCFSVTLSLSPALAGQFAVLGPDLQFAYRLASHFNLALLLAVFAAGTLAVRSGGLARRRHQVQHLVAAVITVAAREFFGAEPRSVVAADELGGRVCYWRRPRPLLVTKGPPNLIGSYTTPGIVRELTAEAAAGATTSLSGGLWSRPGAGRSCENLSRALGLGHHQRRGLSLVPRVGRWPAVELGRAGAAGFTACAAFAGGEFDPAMGLASRSGLVRTQHAGTGRAGADDAGHFHLDFFPDQGRVEAEPGGDGGSFAASVLFPRKRLPSPIAFGAILAIWTALWIGGLFWWPEETRFGLP